MTEQPPNRVRDALIRAARELLAEGTVSPTIPELTARAGVGIGSFYNHFGTKDALVDAAARDAALEHIQWLHRVTGPNDDLIESIALRFRLNCLMPDTHPAIARLYVNPRTSDVMNAVRNEHVGALPQAQLDRAGLGVDEFDAAMTVGNGTTLMLIMRGVRDGAAVPHDEIARVLVLLLRVLGVPDDRARELASRPLPPLPA